MKDTNKNLINLYKEYDKLVLKKTSLNLQLREVRKKLEIVRKNLHLKNYHINIFE